MLACIDVTMIDLHDYLTTPLKSVLDRDVAALLVALQTRRMYYPTA